MVYACFNRQHRLTDLMARGEPLDQVWLESAAALDFVRKYKFGQLVILSIQGFIQSLRGGTGSSAPLDEMALEARVLRGGVALVACFHWILQLQRHFLLGNAERALEFAAKAKPILWSARLNLQSVDYCLYHSLAIAAVFQASSPQRRAELREDLLGHLESFQRWAESSPATFAHKHSLVSAEWARLEGREMEAMQLYEQAIRSAAERGFLQDQALASELAARFYRLHDLERVADSYLDEARDCYARWGALAKVAQLEHSQPQVRQRARLASKPTIEAPVEQFDLATIIKMSQAVAGEIVLEKLIETLMVIAVEHAGADRGLLILQHGGQIEAEASSSRDGVRVRLLGTPVTPAKLPVLILAHVIRTQSEVILDDARGENAFAEDEYIGRKQVRSLLCLPLLKQAELIGVLYLENSLASHVFTPARIAVLKLLASQAAMSLENTRLYRDLAKREAQMRRLVDANIVGIFIWDLDGTILEANDAFLRMVGYECEDLVSGRLRWTNVAAAQWRGRDVREFVAEIQRTGSLQPFEWEHIRKDGSRVHVLLGAASFEGESQGVAFVLDLTERRRAEQALKRSEAYLAEAQRLAHVGSWAYDHVLGKVKHYSDEAFRLFGLDPRPSGPPQLEETRQLIHPGDRERVFEQLAQIFRDKAEYDQQYRIVMPDGTVRHLHSIGHPILNKAGELIEYFGTVMDVTASRHAEHRLVVQHRVTRILSEAATAEEALPKILELMGEWRGWDLGALWQNDRHAGVLRCAELWRTPSLEAAQFEAATRTSTFSPGRGLPGRVWASGAPAYIPDVTRDANFPRAAMAAREGLHGAFAFPILLGREVLGVIEFFSRDVWQRDNDLLVMMATIGSQIGQFIERKRAENALQLAQAELAHVTRVVTLGELTASIAHEVNQPLGAIVTSAAACDRWLAAKPPQMEKARRALERIVNDGRRASEVIKRIRALMKRQAPRKDWLAINAAILEVIALAQYQVRRNDILLETQLAEVLPLVPGDRVQLQQVLLNLIVNAVEAMSEIDQRRRQLTIVSAADGSDTVRIEVRDTGPGLDLDRATQLFEPFYTTKAEGLGIGLSISRSIIEAHGGRLTAGANSPHGAVFCIWLPVGGQTP